MQELPPIVDDDVFYNTVDNELHNESTPEEQDYLDRNMERWRSVLTEKLIASEQHLHNLNVELHLWRREYGPTLNVGYLSPFDRSRLVDAERRIIAKISSTSSFTSHVRRRLLRIKELLRERYVARHQAISMHHELHAALGTFIEGMSPQLLEADGAEQISIPFQAAKARAAHAIYVRAGHLLKEQPHVFD